MRPKSCPVAAPCTDKEKLRLRGGDGACSGRVEVWHEGAWGTVCDDSWSLAEAQVLCRQLGCGTALDAPGRAAFGPGNGSIWLDEVQCGGLEPSLWSCAAAPWGQSDCKHEEDAGVRCSGVRTPASPIPGNTTSFLPLGPGISSLPGILCIILGFLLLLVLTILGIHLHRWRAERQGTIDEAVYQEIDYLINPEEELLDTTGNLSDDSATKLPYYTGDGEENGDPDSAPEAPPTKELGEENVHPGLSSVVKVDSSWDEACPEPPRQHVNGTGDGYDDVEELPVSEIPSSSGIRISPECPREATNSSTEEKASSLFLKEEDSMYDDIELTAM